MLKFHTQTHQDTQNKNEITYKFELVHTMNCCEYTCLLPCLRCFCRQQSFFFGALMFSPCACTIDVSLCNRNSSLKRNRKKQKRMVQGSLNVLTFLFKC